MTPTKLACPHCRRHVPDVYWQNVDVVRCPACQGEFEQVRYPALAASRRVVRASATAQGEANCFFHAQNRAEAACAGCGRYVCSVCKLELSGETLCPSCLESRSTRRKLPENHRVLYDHIAIALAVVPMLIWPVTLLSAPASIAFVVYGWKRPGSLVKGWRRTKLVVAGLIGVAQVAGWMFLFASLWLKAR